MRSHTIWHRLHTAWYILRRYPVANYPGILASITWLAITRHRYDKYFILADYLGPRVPGYLFWFSLETPGTENDLLGMIPGGISLLPAAAVVSVMYPLTHVPLVLMLIVLHTYCTGNLFQIKMMYHPSSCTSSHLRLLFFRDVFLQRDVSLLPIPGYSREREYYIPGLLISRVRVTLHHTRRECEPRVPGYALLGGCTGC